MATATQDQRQSKPLRSYLPILQWLPNYNRTWLRTDLLAGLTIVALLVPEGMAYAELAGMPPQAAFYAAPAGLVLYAMFGSSRQLVVAVSSAIAVMSAATVTDLAPQGSAEFIVLTSVLALLVGAIATLAGILRLGRLAQFFSESVLTGFVFGLALVIAIKQLPKLFGLEAGHGNFFERLWDLIVHLPETHLPTLVVGLACLLLLILLERYFHRIPAALVAMVFGILVVTLFSLDGRGVHIIGEIPAGLAPPKLPLVPLRDVLRLIPGAIGIALVAFAEAIGPARSFASKHKYRIDADQELIGLGMANLGAGLFQGFSIGSSLSKSAANDNAGAKSQMSGLIAAAATILVALFLTPLFRNLPEAALAAIVIVAIAGMFKVKEMWRLYRVRKADFALALVALLGVLIFEVVVGLSIAVATSLLVLIARASAPKLSILGRVPDSIDFSDVRRHPDNRTIPGLVIVRPNEGLFFANATSLAEEIRDEVLSSDPPARAVLLDLEMTFDLDVPSLDALVELKEGLAEEGVDLMLVRVHQDVREMLKHSGVLDKIGIDNVQAHVLDGVLDFLAVSPETEATVQTALSEGVRELMAKATALLEQAQEGSRKEGE
jgi:high affinity sulfate transporter 1